ncbi:unnamed protein product [Pleuronectes platessa]|uniref:Uncharacterized protein n=1 Tax=Pleuronectes platessa TaxID=8262 RepID=A0A9N7VB45_PLEPL|nr:unnamed protein product [Pleuronectes platessa]
MAAHAPPASTTQLWLLLLLLTGRSEASRCGVNTVIHPQQPAEGNGSDERSDRRDDKPIYGGFMMSSADPETCRVGVRSVCAASGGSCTGSPHIEEEPGFGIGQRADSVTPPSSSSCIKRGDVAGWCMCLEWDTLKR